MPSVLPLVADPSRGAILRLVWHRERTAGDIASEMPVTFSAVSQHLKRLRDAGLVTVRRSGRERWYRADRDAFGPLAPALEQLWSASLQRLADLAEREERRARK